MHITVQNVHAIASVPTQTIRACACIGQSAMLYPYVIIKVLEDLIEGDRLYLAELLVIIDCYQRPLRIAMNSGLLPMSHQQLKAIFQNW